MNYNELLKHINAEFHQIYYYSYEPIQPSTQSTYCLAPLTPLRTDYSNHIHFRNYKIIPYQ